MPVFTKGSRIDTKKLRRMRVMLPEFDVGNDKGYVWVRGLSAKEVKDHLAAGEDGVEKKLSDADMLVMAIINEDGTQMFDNADDVNKNFDVSAESLVKIVNAVLEVSGMPKGTPAKN
jgi:hypothetical protein